MLLHDQTEFPLMKDRGFAVAPGTHTIVIVEKGKVGAAASITFAKSPRCLLSALSLVT